MTQAPKWNSPWSELTSLPEPLAHSRFILEPLDEQHAELDFEALMSCRTRLRKQLAWGGGDWPAEDFTMELNRADLRRHHDEFLRREAFAYTVLSPDRMRCPGLSLSRTLRRDRGCSTRLLGHRRRDRC
jgi:hypothetical protein